MKEIIFTTHEAVEDAFDALLLLAHLTKEDGHYSGLITALRQYVREQRDTIVQLTSEKVERVIASDHHHQSETSIMVARHPATD